MMIMLTSRREFRIVELFALKSEYVSCVCMNGESLLDFSVLNILIGEEIRHLVNRNLYYVQDKDLKISAGR